MNQPSPHSHRRPSAVGRRGLLKAAGGATAALAIGASATALTSNTAQGAPVTFTHRS